MKKFLVLIIIAVFLLPLGCTSDAPVDQLPQLNNNLTGDKLIIQSTVGNFELIREYSTSYNTSKWRITDSKTLNMKVYTSGVNEATVMIEHVHIDVNIQSTYQGFDGWLQDSMDDSFHGTQGGFWVTDSVSYNNIFAIEGFSQVLIEGWAWMIGGYGGGYINSYRLTENNLVKHGKVYGNKFSIIYDVIVKEIDEPYFHVYCVADEFLVPVEQIIQ